MPKSTKSRYSLHPAYRMEDAYRRNIAERTGKTIEQWLAFAKRDGPKDKKELGAWLRTKHGLTTNYVHWIVSGETGGSESYDPDQLVKDLFSEKKAALRPIYDRLLDLGFDLGDDVKACPCQTMVPLYRKYVFAEIKPTTNTRIDLGLALAETPEKGRLESLGARAVGNRITHRIPIASVEDIDREVEKWLEAAYEKGNEERDRAPLVSKGGEAKVPPDLKKAIAASKKAQATFDSCTPRMRAEWVDWIVQSVKPETRAKRIATAVSRLTAGKKRMY